MTYSAAKEAIYRFLRVSGAGIIAVVLMILAGMTPGPEIVLAIAVLTALDKYMRDKGITAQVYKTTIGRFTK